MIDQKNLKQFNEIYDSTYNDVLYYVISNISDINDVNDVLQETYIELFKIMNKKELDYANINAYLKGIARNKIRKHFSLLAKMKTISLFSSKEDIELIDTIASTIDLESIIINEDLYEQVWNYLKQKKTIIVKIFVLYYCQDLSIKEISSLLNISESYVKNCLYRTINELKKNFVKESEKNE